MGIVRLLLRRQDLNPAEAEDVFQRFVERVYSGAANIRSPKAVRAWLYGVARNLCLEHIRARRACPETSIPEGFEVEAEQSHGDDALFAKTIEADLKKAIAELPEDLRNAYILVVIEECSPTEACRELGCGRTTLWDRIRAAGDLIHSAVRFGMIEGSVRDSGGERVGGVSVTLRGRQIPLSRRTLTNKRDSFRFHLLPPGEYLLLAEAAEYTKWRESIVVSPGRVAVEIRLSSREEHAASDGGQG